MSPWVLALLCAMSGAAALIYEVVWLQMLQLVVGSSELSTGVLLGAFMGGLCLGSLVAPRLLARRRDPLRVFASLEAATAICAIGMLAALPFLSRVYFGLAISGAFDVPLRALLGAVCLLPPTVAMGATLPALARWTESTANRLSWVGWFYAANIAGGVCGSLLAGFVLLRLYDMAVATYVAAGMNVIAAGGVAASGFLTSRASSRERGRARREAVSHDERSSGEHPLGLFADRTRARAYERGTLIVIAISGFCALVGEVVWTRTLALLFGASVYTFSIIVAIFLIGLGLGGASGSWVVQRISRAGRALGWCQVLAVVAIGWAAYALTAVLPYVAPLPSSASIWMVMSSDFWRACLAVLPAPMLWGASFPLALVAVSQSDDDYARLVGSVYAANTIGAIAGALGASLVLISSIGSQHVQQLMILASAAAAMVALWNVARRAVPAILAVTAACIAIVPPLPGLLVSYGRHAANWNGHTGEIVYVGEGVNGTIAISRLPNGVLNYHNAGKIQASSEPQDMRLQRLLGHLTTLVPQSPRSVLVIGCGAGVTAGAVAIDPRVEQVSIAEIEPLVPAAAARFFGAVNENVLRSPKTRVWLDDARHVLATTGERFDAITSDPLDPWVKGSASLYTKEFFELAKAHLNPGGVMTLFVQLYESSPETVRSEMATFFGAFPEGVIFGNTFDGQTADMVLVGQVGPMEIDVDTVDWWLGQPAWRDVRRSLGEIGIFSSTQLFSNYGGRAPELADWLRGAAINTDRNLRLQYFAGLGLNLHEGSLIYADILKRRGVPADLFVGSPSTLAGLLENAPE